jgi:hypothetical protein
MMQRKGTINQASAQVMQLIGFNHQEVFAGKKRTRRSQQMDHIAPCYFSFQVLNTTYSISTISMSLLPFSGNASRLSKSVAMQWGILFSRTGNPSEKLYFMRLSEEWCYLIPSCEPSCEPSVNKSIIVFQIA